MITLRKELKRKTGGLRSRKVAKASLALYSVNIASGSSRIFSFRHSRLNNRPVWQEDGKEHLPDCSFDRV